MQYSQQLFYLRRRSIPTIIIIQGKKVMSRQAKGKLTECTSSGAPIALVQVVRTLSSPTSTYVGHFVACCVVSATTCCT